MTRKIDPMIQPLWQRLEVSDTDPFGGLFGKDGGNTWGSVTCVWCGALVRDRGLHYRFHAQINELFRVLGEREVVHEFSSEDEEAGALVERMVEGVLIDTRKKTGRTR